MFFSVYFRNSELGWGLGLHGMPRLQKTVNSKQMVEGLLMSLATLIQTELCCTTVGVMVHQKQGITVTKSCVALGLKFRGVRVLLAVLHCT